MASPSSPAPLPDDTRPLRELVGAGRFRDALDWFRTTGSDLPRPEWALLAATAATRLGEFALGESLAGQALDRYRQRADQDGQMRALNLRGAIAFEEGRLPEAQPAFATVLTLARELEDGRMAARASNNLGSVVHLQGSEEEALELFRGAMLEHQRLGDRRGAAEAYHNLGIAYRQLGAWQLAENAANQAVRHAELIGDPSLIVLVLCGRAEVDLEREDWNLARQRLDRAATLARRAGDEIGLTDAQRLTAQADLSEGDTARAATESVAVHARAQHLGSALLSAECAALAALATRRIGRLQEAERYRASALEGFERLGAARLRERFVAEWDREAAEG